jgi:nucleotide-binding universal stress UspA family protein
MNAPVVVDQVLVPVDGSDESTRAAEYAAAVADRYDAAVLAVYVVGEQLARGIETGAVEKAEVRDEAESYLREVETVAADHGVELSTEVAYGFSTTRKSQHPGSVVLDYAEDADADFVVVPREPQTGEPGEVLAKAAEYVLLYASQPVLSV